MIRIAVLYLLLNAFCSGPVCWGFFQHKYQFFLLFICLYILNRIVFILWKLQSLNLKKIHLFLFSVYYECFACFSMCPFGAHEGKKRVLNSLELLGATLWVLGPKPGSCARSSSILTTVPSFQLWNWIQKLFLYFMCTFCCLNVCIMYVPGACGGQKSALDILELALHVNYHVGSGNQIRILCS